MGSGIFFPISALPFSILMIILIYKKEHVINNETNIYKKLVILNFIGLILEILCSYASLIYNNHELVSNFIYKTYLVYLISWTAMFAYYIRVISTNKISIPFAVKNVIYPLLVIVIFFIYYLPIELILKNDFQIRYTAGPSVNFTYIVSGLIILLILLLIIKDIKNIINKKYIPVFTFFIVGTLSMIIEFFMPQLLLLTYVETLICVIMYFTIENPDVKMLKQVEMAKEEAENANKAKSDFLSAMSHEIRTPLNAIVGFSESLKEESLTPSQEEEVNDIIDASQTLLETVNGILDISKIEANKIEIINTTYEFEKVFNELVALSKARLGEDRPIEFRYHLAQDVPKFLYGDYARVKQVILNFLTNAIKYTKEGYIDFNVKCINNEGISRLIITVEDSGIGIKKESINKLFDKFERLDNENSTIEGTGLGLAITKRLVEMMHGKIVVQSFYGKGSQFTVILDQRIVNNTEFKHEEEKQDDIINHDLSTKKVLIVDDNLMNLKVAARLLKQYNLIIEQADSGFKCLDLIGAGNTYDLILMDDMMPKKSGKETFKELKSDPTFNTPVVILTANAITGMKEEYLNFGFNDYLAKPIEKIELNRVIKKYLDK